MGIDRCIGSVASAARPCEIKTLLWRRNGLGREEPNDTDTVKYFGLTPKINQKPFKNFKHLIESYLY